MTNGKAPQNNGPPENALAQNRRHSCNSPDVGFAAEHQNTAGSTVMSGDNLEGVVRVPDRNRLSLHVNRRRHRGVENERNEIEMVQCAVVALPLCPEATTSRGSCFMILCKACAEKYSCFMCLRGLEESSTSSIEKDVSGQGNSVVCESFSENQSPGFDKEHSCTAFGVRSEGVIQNSCVDNEDNLQKSLKSADDCGCLAEKSGAKSKEEPALDSSSKEIESTASVQEKVNVNSEEVQLCCEKGHILLTESEAEIPVKKIFFSCAKTSGFLHEEEHSIPVSCKTVRQPCIASLAQKFSADEEKSNQFSAGDFFEASNRLKRLEAHFKGFACAKKQIASQDNLKEISYTPKYLEKGLCFQENEQPLCPTSCRGSHRLTSGIDPRRFNAVNNPPHFCPESVKGDNTNVKICHNISLDENFNNGHLKPSENIGEQSKVKSIQANYNKQSSFQISELQTVSEGLNKDKPFECDSHLNVKCPPEYVSLFNLQFESPCSLKSEFDVRFLHNFNEVEHALECYDELGLENFDYCSEDEFDLSSYCSLDEVVPFNSGSSQLTMRELNGPLRGLLKKPNRPAQARKNRVVFDETRNEFFEADYIILIREDCAYDEEDEEPCTCGEHELIRLCCEEGCQCNYNEENITPQVNSPKYAPPIEFVDEAALSPPEGYKDNGLKNTLTGALSGHVFGAQHIQQLQVIQRLQQQRAAMLAARATNQQQSHTTQQQQQQQQQQQPVQVPDAVEDDQQTVCTECAECVECAAKQIQEAECISGQCQEELSQLSVPAVAIIPLHNNSPERRITQKEIIAGEERPKYLLANQLKGPPEEETEKILSVHKNQRYVVETITMTTVTERRIVREATEDITTVATGYAPSESAELSTESQAAQSPKPDSIPSPAQISGILKGGKLWKNEQSQVEEPNTTPAEDEANLKRSVRFLTEGNKEISREGDGQAQTENAETDNPINELIPFKKHSTLFNNALRPNSAVRQLFPSIIHPPPTSAVLTHEALRAFDESKRGNTLVSNLLSATSETDTIRRTIERNALRRSLIKKKAAKTDISLEERIKQLTCDIDESTDETALCSSDGGEKSFDYAETERRDSPAGEENPHQVKYIPDKSFSPSSSASSSSSGSTSAYKKISDIFNRDKRQEKIPETDENPIVIIPQECRCPAAPDLGMGVQVPAAHTQIHQTPPRQTEPRRQFLSTLAPLTACVAGQKDDLSYYTLATGERNSTASAQCSEYSLGDIESALFNNDARKVAPDVIAGTPGQEQDELVTFANQEASRTDKIKKRYSNESSTVQSNPSSDDDEQNDYGFNKRPSVRGIKPKFSSTNEILQQMQAQLSQPITPQQNVNKTFSLPKQSPNPATTLQQSSQTTGITQQQSERAWGFYAEADQRISGEHFNQQAGYYQPLPGAIKHTYHGHEESLMYQNCHSVTMEQHYRKYARSPTRRPESPPPLRNCHQTMVLIPYNTESYAQFSSNDPKATHQFSRQNILEYQQVTQQTIRVPISYTLPGMQLHVVAGRGTQSQYQHNPRLMAPRIYNFQQDPNFAERGVPEGAATASHTDCKNLMSPTSSQANQQNCTQASTITTSVPGAVFYAMNV